MGGSGPALSWEAAGSGGGSTPGGPALGYPADTAPGGRGEQKKPKFMHKKIFAKSTAGKPHLFLTLTEA